jgi:hypothetical protein
LGFHLVAELGVPVLVLGDVGVLAGGGDGLLGGGEGGAQVQPVTGADDRAEGLGRFREDAATFLREEKAQPLLATGHVLPLRGDDERLAAAGEDAGEGDLVAGQRGRRGKDHVEVGRDGVLHLILQPGADRNEDRFPLQPLVLGLDVVQPFPARQQVATLRQLVDGLQHLGYGRSPPGIRLQILDVPNRVRIVLPEHLVEEELAGVLRMDAGGHPWGDAGALDLLAQGQHFVPGLGVLVALRFHIGGAVPDAEGGQRPVEQVLGAVEDAGLLRAGHQGFADGLALGVEGGRGQQIGQVSELAFGHQRGVVQVAGAGVVDHVRRGAGHEAGLQLLAQPLDAGVGDLRVRELSGVHLVDVDGVVVAEAALEDDHVEGSGRVHAQRVVRGLSQCAHRHRSREEGGHGGSGEAQGCRPLQDLAAGIVAAGLIGDEPLDLGGIVRHRTLLHSLHVLFAWAGSVIPLLLLAAAPDDFGRLARAASPVKRRDSRHATECSRRWRGDPASRRESSGVP